MIFSFCFHEFIFSCTPSAHIPSHLNMLCIMYFIVLERVHHSMFVVSSADHLRSQRSPHSLLSESKPPQRPPSFSSIVISARLESRSGSFYEQVESIGWVSSAYSNHSPFLLGRNGLILNHFISKDQFNANMRDDAYCLKNIECPLIPASVLSC